MHGTNDIQSTLETPFLGEATLLAQRLLVPTDCDTIKWSKRQGKFCPRHKFQPSLPVGICHFTYETFGTIGAITPHRKFDGNPYKPSRVHCICNTNACKWGEQSAKQLLKIVTEVRPYCCTVTVEGSRERQMEADWEEKRKATNVSIYVKKTGRTFRIRKSTLRGNCIR